MATHTTRMLPLRGKSADATFTYHKSESAKPLNISGFAHRKWRGGCACWWGFHIYTPAPIFKFHFSGSLPAILNPFPHILNIIPGNLDHVPLHYFLLSRKTFQYTLYNIYIAPTPQALFSQISPPRHIDFLISKSPKFPSPQF